MEKTIKIKSIVITVLIFICVFLILDVVPFIFLWAGMSAKGVPNQIELQKWAVKTSVFKFQKIYTRNSILPLLVLSGDHDTAINYFNDLEKLGGADSLNTKLVTYSYIQSGDYENALRYANMINDRSRMVQVYIKLKNYAKANNVVDSLLMEKDIKSSTYLYKSELLYNEGKYVEANNYIDKALKSSSSYIDGLYMKSKILTKLGRTAEANKYFNIAKYAEAKRKEIYE